MSYRAIPFEILVGARKYVGDKLEKYMPRGGKEKKLIEGSMNRKMLRGVGEISSFPQDFKWNSPSRVYLHSCATYRH